MIDLRPYQREAIDFVRDAWKRQPGAIVALPMGAGKTATAIALADQLEAKRVLCIAPLSVCPAWPAQLRKHSTRDWATRDLTKHSVARATKQLQFQDPLCLYLVNPERAWRKPLGLDLLQDRFDLVIVDECHKAKAPAGKYSRWLQRFAPTPAVGLTGTVLPHSHCDVYGQARAFAPALFGTSWWRFRNRYCVMGGYERRQVVGIANEAEYHAKLSRLVFERTKAEVLPHLPAETDEERYFDLPPKARTLYDRLASDFYAEIENETITVANGMTKLLRLQQVAAGFTKLDSGEIRDFGSPKLGALEDLLDEGELPVVVFCRFTHDLDDLRYLAEKRGLVYDEVSGSRKDLVDGQMKPTTQLLGVQVQAGSLGIDLTRARVSVFYTLPLPLVEYVQSRARLHRQGQTRPVVHVHLLARDTVDERILAAHRARENVIEHIMKETRSAQSRRLRPA